MEASSIVWVTVTPLGLPVEPEVHRISIGWSGPAGFRAPSAATASGGAALMSSSRSMTGSVREPRARHRLQRGARRRGGWPTARSAPRSGRSCRPSSGRRAGPGRRRRARRRTARRRSPGPGAPWISTRARGSRACARRAAALATAAPNAVMVIEVSRVVELRTPRNGASPRAATAPSRSAERVGGRVAGSGVGGRVVASRWGASHGRLGEGGRRPRAMSIARGATWCVAQRSARHRCGPVRPAIPRRPRRPLRYMPWRVGRVRRRPRLAIRWTVRNRTTSATTTYTHQITSSRESEPA